MTGGELQLAWPWLLLAWPLVFLARWLPRAGHRPVQALRLPGYQRLAGATTGPGAPPGRLARTLALLVWTLVVLAAARPQWLGEPVALPVSGRDLMLAVDLSGSMAQEDFQLDGRPATRLDVVKRVAGRFIEARSGDRIGLILFGSRAYLATPLTFDRSTVVNFLREAVLGLAGRQTAIGDAIGLAVKRLRALPGDDKVLILLTDGANTAGNLDPLDAARLAAGEGIRIYTIGLGGGETGLRTPFGVLLSRPADDYDPRTLEEIARLTGGRFFQASDSAGLEAVYRELDALEPVERSEEHYRPLAALYPWPAGLALLLAAGLLAQRLRRPPGAA